MPADRSRGWQGRADWRPNPQNREYIGVAWGLPWDKALADIAARIDRKLDLDYPKQVNNRTEVLYGYDANNKFIDDKLSQKDAQAVLDLMDAKEGTTIAGGENLLIEHDGKKLFETDAQGVVTYSAYDRDPELLNSVKLKDEKGLTELKNYAKRMAATPDNQVKVTKTDEVVIPDPPQEIKKVETQSGARQLCQNK